MTNPSPFLAPSRPQNARHEESEGSDTGPSLAQLVDAAAASIVTLVLRWIDGRDHVERGRAR